MKKILKIMITEIRNLLLSQLHLPYLYAKISMMKGKLLTLGLNSDSFDTKYNQLLTDYLIPKIM